MVIVHIQGDIQHLRVATLGSWILAAFAVFSAFSNRANAYAALIELSSGFNLMVLCFALGTLIIEIGNHIQKLVFGELRLIESEHLRENLSYELLNITYTVAMFSSGLSLTIIPFIVTVLYSNIYQRILIDRLDFTFQNLTSYAEIVRHRIVIFSLLSLVWDAVLIRLVFGKQMNFGPDIYTQIALDVIMTGLDLAEATFRHILSFDPHYADDDDEDDNTRETFLYTKTLEIFISILRVAVSAYVINIFVRSDYIPLFHFHQLYKAGLNLKKQIALLQNHIKVTRTLDDLLEIPTEEDLEKDNVCIICRDEMELDWTHRKRMPRKLHCGHTLHLNCLKSWMDRSESCPMCRRPVFQDKVVQAKVDGVEHAEHADPAEHAEHEEHEENEEHEEQIPEPLVPEQYQVDPVREAQRAENVQADTVPMGLEPTAHEEDSIITREIYLRTPHVEAPNGWTAIPVKREGYDHKAVVNMFTGLKMTVMPE